MTKIHAVFIAILAGRERPIALEALAAVFTVGEGDVVVEFVAVATHFKHFSKSILLRCGEAKLLLLRLASLPAGIPVFRLAIVAVALSIHYNANLICEVQYFLVLYAKIKLLFSAHCPLLYAH